LNFSNRTIFGQVIKEIAFYSSLWYSWLVLEFTMGGNYAVLRS